MSTAAAASELEELLKVVGDDLIRAYRDKYFPSRIIQACPSIYSVENAAKWVNFDKFCAFVAHAFQERSPPPPEPAGPVRETEDPPRKRARASSSSPSALGAPMHTLGSGEDDTPQKQTQKRKRGDRRPPTKVAAGLTRVTRQCWVEQVELLTEPPENWRVPRPGESVAYVLDISRDPHEYKDAKGKLLAMSAIIKHKCTDGWTGGSGGSLSKATMVPLLGEDVKCQKMSHECRGSFVCSLSAPDLWANYERYDLDIEASAIHAGDQDTVEQDDSVHIKKTLAFYNNVVKEKCQFDNPRCLGRPVLKLGQQILSEGKFYYVECSAGTAGDTHFSRQIPAYADEEVLQQLFSTGRVNFANTVVPDGPCNFQVPTRTGLKQKQCPHVHVHGGKIVEGDIMHRPCPAKITMFSPVDHTLRKAVVLPLVGVPHNHPSHPSDKLTRRAKAALRAAGIADARGGTGDRYTPSVDGDCSTPQMGAAAGPSHSTLASESSISSALMTPGYNVEHFY